MKAHKCKFIWLHDDIIIEWLNDWLIIDDWWKINDDESWYQWLRGSWQHQEWLISSAPNDNHLTQDLWVGSWLLRSPTLAHRSNSVW